MLLTATRTAPAAAPLVQNKMVVEHIRQHGRGVCVEICDRDGADVRRNCEAERATAEREGHGREGHGRDVRSRGVVVAETCMAETCESRHRVWP